MAETKKAAKKNEIVSEYGQTLEEYREAHGGRDPEPEPDLEVDDKHQKQKKEARWG